MLTKIQKKVLYELNRYIELNEVAPTVRELCLKVGLKSVSTMHVHLSNLESKHYIERVAKSPRNIKILKLDDSLFDKNYDNTIICGGSTMINEGNTIRSHLKYRLRKENFNLIKNELIKSIASNDTILDINQYNHIDIIYCQFTGITALEFTKVNLLDNSLIEIILTNWTRSKFFNIISKLLA